MSSDYNKQIPVWAFRVFRVLQNISKLLKALWVYFPGILFIILSIVVFWTLGQGKDIMIAYAENHSQYVPVRVIFFSAICFWVYVSWYSSRIISYIKIGKQKDLITAITGSTSTIVSTSVPSTKNDLMPVQSGFLESFPRILGNACFLALEMAVLRSPLLVENPLLLTTSLLIFLGLLLALHYGSILVYVRLSVKPWFRKLFKILFGTTIAYIGFISALEAMGVFSFNAIFKMWEMFALLVMTHISFILFIHLRRAKMEQKNIANLNSQNPVTHASTGFISRIMNFFCVPDKERGYFVWYLIIKAIGFVIYISAIIWLVFARGIGPFPFIILAFGVLLAFGNMVAAFSMKYNINFHFLLFLLAAILSIRETHDVRTVHLKNNSYADRPDLKTYLYKWLSEKPISDSTKEYPIYFVMANGGASRSGYWTAAVLGRIEDSTLKKNPNNRFSDHVFCLSGTSGGGVGVASFFSMLRDKKNTDSAFDISARKYLGQDYFTYTFSRMLGPDYFNYIFHTSVADRAAALEYSFDESARRTETGFIKVPFDDSFSNFPAIKNGKINLPILCINTTRMQDGNPAVVSNIMIDTGTFNHRVDVVALLDKNKDIRLSTAAILGARFPYLSPAGEIEQNKFDKNGDVIKGSALSHYFVDGGYFDNSGAGVVQEIIRGILNLQNTAPDSIKKKIAKLHFMVIHITNSPVLISGNILADVAPLKNDLMAPILTIFGAYDMQTTVNDSRLIHYINDLKTSNQKAEYLPINLYKDHLEWAADSLSKTHVSEAPYAMNWFMSDTVRKRIDNRLISQPSLINLIANFDTNK